MLSVLNLLLQYFAFVFIITLFLFLYKPPPLPHIPPCAPTTNPQNHHKTHCKHQQKQIAFIFTLSLSLSLSLFLLLYKPPLPATHTTTTKPTVSPQQKQIIFIFTLSFSLSSSTAATTNSNPQNHHQKKLNLYLLSLFHFLYKLRPPPATHKITTINP